MTRIVIAGGQVFDGTGTPAEAADVLVEGGQIVDVGTGLDGDVRVDATGHTVLPGLFDCHVHLLFDSADLVRSLNTPFSLPFYQAIGNMRATLDCGITTVRDAAGADLGVAEAVRQGLVEGPRMQIAVNMISQTGGHNDSWMACGAEIPQLLPPYPGMPGGVADGPEELRKVVRSMIRAGADVIKIASSGGVMSPRSNPRHAHLRDEELAMVVREAEAAGIAVMSHAMSGDGILAAVRNGVRSIEHGVFLTVEAIEEMCSRGTWLVPTLLAPRMVLGQADAGVPVSDVVLAKARTVVAEHAASFRAAVDAGVRIAMGTDSGVGPHGDNLTELTLMTQNGMKPAQALHAATRSAAELMGLREELGTIEAGKRADLVLVEGDAEQHVLDGTLKDAIRAVYQDGRKLR
ncbi:metal-dependent hydrolase family protein [Amycolatopsis suaedae]|uniref:Amidohydrolase family protein n=1 Tax=Amycolatopsis suaedae TaxID=2510978 RepID=A0A4Q7J8B3_9PSEU|nr:amidohydrolase family protein [Amycolatopsis suaedae]RZQ63930.1 amidohydrolase family protein [Amycolatopsis suaedae]